MINILLLDHKGKLHLEVLHQYQEMVIYLYFHPHVIQHLNVNDSQIQQAVIIGNPQTIIIENPQAIITRNLQFIHRIGDSIPEVRNNDHLIRK